MLLNQAKGQSQGGGSNITLATFKTRSGKEAIRVTKHFIGRFTSYSYTGALGAGSGTDLSDVKLRVQACMAGRRFVRQVQTSEEFESA